MIQRAATWSRPGEAFALFFRGATWRSCWRVAVVVGTVLSLVNQGETIMRGSASVATWVRVGVNYVVPFLVSSYGYLAARRAPSPT